MSHRLHTLAAAVALTVLTTAQAFALTTSQIAFTSPYPQLQITCFTRVFVSPTSSQIYSRRCDSGEKPGSFKVIYHG